MSTQEYLDAILLNQKLGDDSEEMKALQKERANVESLLKAVFKESNPTIRYGGSKAKGTMVRESYDLDVICYFAHDDTTAGEALGDIFKNVKKALEEKYSVIPKTLALRLRGKQDLDFHIDVVPGRYTDASRGDSYLHVNGKDKDRLKTNLDKHIEHVRGSGRADEICLMKLWKLRNGLDIKTFVLELLVIDILKGSKAKDLDARLTKVWEHLRDHADDLSVEDPANPQGNDLSHLLSSSLKKDLKRVASATLDTIEKDGWKAVFGEAKRASPEERAAAIRSTIAARAPAKPWCSG